MATTAATLPQPIKLAFALLVVPVIDNTATPEGAWSLKPHAPWLSTERMLWFRRQYIPNPADWTNWRASPNLAPAEDIQRARLPTFIAVADHDILSTEALAYGALLQEHGYPVTVQSIGGATHSILLLDARVTSAVKLREDASAFVVRHFQEAG